MHFILQYVTVVEQFSILVVLSVTNTHTMNAIKDLIIIFLLQERVIAHASIATIAVVMLIMFNY